MAAAVIAAMAAMAGAAASAANFKLSFLTLYLGILMKHNGSHMIFGAAALAVTILMAGPVQAEEKYLPPAPPPPNFVGATEGLVAPPPVVAAPPARIIPAPEKQLPQYDTGPIVAPPGAVEPASKAVTPVIPPVKPKTEPAPLPKGDTFHSSEKPKDKVLKELKDTKSGSEHKTDAVQKDK